jgi:hypothetical protein
VGDLDRVSAGDHAFSACRGEPGMNSSIENPCASMSASGTPSRLPTSISSARRRVASGLRVRLRSGIADGRFKDETLEPALAASGSPEEEDGPDPVSLGFVDGYLAVFCVVAERRHAADPERPLRLST